MTRMRWVGSEESSTEACDVAMSDRGMVANGVVETSAWRLLYCVETDEIGRFRTGELTTGSRTLRLSNSAGRWTVNDEPRDDLEGATEIDISVTPLTNSLPIRRLGLAIGESADVDTAWIAVPSLTVVRDPQRYTRIGEKQWLYESRDSDFRAILTVDDEGLVLDYPGLFRAVT